jgi:hypothetical protein
MLQQKQQQQPYEDVSEPCQAATTNVVGVRTSHEQAGFAPEVCSCPLATLLPPSHTAAQAAQRHLCLA